MPKSPFLTDRLAMLLFVFFGIGAISWFLYILISIAEQIFTRSETVTIFKGGLYMLGVGLGFLILSFAMIWETWAGKEMTAKLATILTRLCILSLAIMLLAPHIIHYSADYYLKNTGYEICEEASHQWLHVRTIVYVQDMDTCSALAER